jgi:undecaprenyl diphosphate synthase
VIGNYETLPGTLVQLLRRMMEETGIYDTWHLVVALSYGARDEILRAIRRYLHSSKDDHEKLDEEKFSQFLDTAGIPDPDLLIRTSGEQRISNFLLWQCAYTEFVFVPEFWPDFSVEVFRRALHEYARRERRYGDIGSGKILREGAS